MNRTPLSALVLTSVVAAATPLAAQAPQNPLQPGVVDRTTPLESRIGDADAAVLKMFAEAGLPTPSRHALTADERAALMRAFAALPPVHQRVVRERLRRLSFLDGMPNTALTSMVETGDGIALYDLTIRASVLRETVSEFLTEKERTCFDLDSLHIALRKQQLA